jgi:uncharacterized protein (TIGR02679 family)
MVSGALAGSSSTGASAVSNSERLRTLLGVPELSWLVERIRVRLERGEHLDGTVTLVGASAEQRRAAARLLGHRVGRGTSLSIPLPEVDAALRRAGIGGGLHAAVEALSGHPVRDPVAERAGQVRIFHDSLDTARRSRLAGNKWFAAWLDEITRDASLIRMIRQGQQRLLAEAVAVLERLPTGIDESAVLLPALAEAVTDSQDGLNGTPLAGLVLRALAHREAVPVPSGPDATRALWAAAGVVTDDLASQVLVLNVRAGGDRLGGWLTDAADAGEPFRVTLHQLSVMTILPLAIDLHVCESPAVLRAAAAQLGPACAPLVCTEGEPSVACYRLLRTAVATGTRVHWHSSLDWTGLRAADAAIRRLSAVPWLMSADDYSSALPLTNEPLRGQPAASPWDPRLAELMQSAGRAVTEDRQFPALLAALAAR